MLIWHQPFRNVLFIVHLQQIAFHIVADGVQRQVVIFCTKRIFQLFCQGIQSFSPVDAHVTPIPDDMPGYADKIIMAAGDFVQGSSIELSADGPIRDPYMIYLQGGIVFEHNVLAILSAAQYIAEHREGAAHD
mgnify:CR=1 FL=1